MAAMVLTDMRQRAIKQLLEYRVNKTRIASHALRGVEREKALRWLRAIEAARAIFHDAMPEKEHAMVRLFGLETPVPQYQKTRPRLLRIARELNVSESTLYKWREEITLLVMGAAIESGAISPFGVREAVERQRAADSGEA